MSEERQATGLHATPTTGEKRPVGVKLLAVMAFGVSAPLAVTSIYLVISFWRDRAENPQDLVAYAGIAMTVLCLLTLAIVSAVAGVDLLKLRKRGRSLTIVSMVFISLLGVYSTALWTTENMHDIQLLCVGLTMCSVSFSTILYLRLAKVRQRFKGSLPIERD